MPTRAGFWKALSFRLAAVAFGLFVAAACAEAVLRSFPVVTGLMAQPVDAEHPVFHFEPGRPFVWSVGWNFALVNRGRANNVGFINDQDYETGDDSPLLAVVGDSYVEAPMVPYAETLQGRLAAAYADRGHVYSFGASGAPLSQYLVWAAYAHEHYDAQGLVVVIVGNDFDESLAKYKQGPGFHHYVDGPGSKLVLQRFDYAPSPLRGIVRRSALVRYLVFNLHAEARVQAWFNGTAAASEAEAAEVSVLARLKAWLIGTVEGIDAESGEAPGKEEAAPATAPFVGNTSALTEPERVADSLRAIDAFLTELPARAGLPVDRIALVVDGLRPHLYDGGRGLEAVRHSYFALMRSELMMRAHEAGYEVIDLNEAFMEAYRHDGQRFESTHDAHWNSAGHAVVSQVVAASRVAATVFGDRGTGY